MFLNTFKCLVDALKKDLQIELNSPVVHITTPPEGEKDGLVKLKTSHGTVYYAKQIVVTSSPYVLKSGVMQFQPPLAPEIQDAIDSVLMNSIVKVIVKFSKPVWPRNVHGMIMTDERFLIPEMWFRDVSMTAAEDEPAKAYGVGFTTAEYAARLSALPKEEVLRRVISQLDEVFGKLEQKHMAAEGDGENEIQKVRDLPKPSDAYLGGMFWDWNPTHHPFIGGGYCSPRAHKAAHLIERLSKPYGQYICFAGEATNLPGATAHAALESGERAAENVANRLK
jgi:monoamine oxidase